MRVHARALGRILAAATLLAAPTRCVAFSDADDRLPDGAGGVPHDAGAEDAASGDPDGTDEPAPACKSDAECAPPKPICNVTAGVCVECLKNESCGANEVCLLGACVCGGAFKTCGDKCVSLKLDPNHCGACETACDGWQCMNGKCCQKLLGEACVADSECCLGLCKNGKCAVQ